MNRLVLIDGNAVLHRAYHALPPLTAPDGSVVNAVYGFASMVMRLIGDLRPTHIAVAFDRPAPTFRKKLYKEYQSQRPKMEDDLVSQIPKVHDLVSALGIPIFEKDGFEADDVIGTLAKGAKKKGIDQVIIVTGDRDILQLVEDEKILVYMPTKGLSEAKLYGEKEVKERLGVTPAHITDFKGLAGDSSDDYPGVEGIGPKTAVNLIDEFGTVEALYKALGKDKHIKLSAGVIEKLQKGKDMAMMSKDLATIRTNVPLEGDIKPLGELNRPEAVASFTQFGFRTLLKRLTGQEPLEKSEKKVKKPVEKNSEQQELF